MRRRWWWSAPSSRWWWKSRAMCPGCGTWWWSMAGRMRRHCPASVATVTSSSRKTMAGTSPRMSAGTTLSRSCSPPGPPGPRKGRASPELRDPPGRDLLRRRRLRCTGIASTTRCPCSTATRSSSPPCRRSCRRAHGAGRDVFREPVLGRGPQLRLHRVQLHRQHPAHPAEGRSASGRCRQSAARDVRRRRDSGPLRGVREALRREAGRGVRHERDRPSPPQRSRRCPPGVLRKAASGLRGDAGGRRRPRNRRERAR